MITNRRRAISFKSNVHLWNSEFRFLSQCRLYQRTYLLSRVIDSTEAIDRITYWPSRESLVKKNGRVKTNWNKPARNEVPYTVYNTLIWNYRCLLNLMINFVLANHFWCLSWFFYIKSQLQKNILYSIIFRGSLNIQIYFTEIEIISTNAFLNWIRIIIGTYLKLFSVGALLLSEACRSKRCCKKAMNYL